METNVNMSKSQFGVYDISLAEWLNKKEFVELLEADDYCVNDIMTSFYDNIIIPTDAVRRDVVYVLLNYAYQQGLKDCKEYGSAEAKAFLLDELKDALKVRNIGQVDKRAIIALMKLAFKHTEFHLNNSTHK